MKRASGHILAYLELRQEGRQKETNVRNCFLTGDEIVSSTHPSLIKVDTSLKWFYLRMKGGPAEVTLSTVYGYNENAYKFVFGYGDGTGFSIRDQGKVFFTFTLNLNESS